MDNQRKMVSTYDIHLPILSIIIHDMFIGMKLNHLYICA